MENYRETFSLKPRDIELIERALRNELSRHAKHALSGGDVPTIPPETREINALLAKIYHQKIFFSQVRRTGVPGG
jgi:hypothetical protein